MEQSLQRPRVSGASRTYHDLRPVLQRDDALLMHGICGLGGEILIRPNVAQLLGCRQQALAPTWMRDLDQCHRSLADRFPEQVRYAVLSDFVIHVRPCDPYPIAGL